MALINCKDVSLGYEGRTILSDVNFELNGGEYLFIIGENGAGKSTLIKGLLKLKKPMSGQITIGDGLKSNEIGYLPQQTVVQKDFPACPDADFTIFYVEPMDLCNRILALCSLDFNRF